MLALLCASSGLAVGSKSFVSKPFVRRCSALTLKDEDGSWSLKSSVPMPDKLAEWGCDDTLWSQVRSKQPLIDFAEAGDENAARERIAMLRASPSITGAGAHAPLPENIASMGCDAELWSKVRSKQALIDLAAGGNEEQLRSRIEMLRARVAGESAAPSSRSDATPKAAAGKKQGKKRTAYELKRGSVLPEGVEEAAINTLLAKRVEAKTKRDFEAADKIQAELLATYPGLYLNDRSRLWTIGGTC